VTDRELLTHALGWLDGLPCETLRAEIKARLEQPEQEPKTLSIDRLDKWLDASLKERAAQRPWVGLTEAEVDKCWNMTPMDTRNSRHMFAYSIETKLKEKNT